MTAPVTGTGRLILRAHGLDDFEPLAAMCCIVDPERAPSWPIPAE